MSQKELSTKTGIRQATISAYYNETAKHIVIDHLDAICKVFNCKLTDVIDYFPETHEYQEEYPNIPQALKEELNTYTIDSETKNRILRDMDNAIIKLLKEEKK